MTARVIAEKELPMNQIVRAHKIADQAHTLRGEYLREALSGLWHAVRHARA